MKEQEINKTSIFMDRLVAEEQGVSMKSENLKKNVNFLFNQAVQCKVKH